MNLGEEYRWNINKITYGFDESFLNFFGARGTAAVMKAVAILNNLPPVSQMSSNLAEFPTDTRRINYQAAALGLRDLKSWALGIMMEQLGFTSPDRYVWTLRDKTPVAPGIFRYTVIKRNFDPVTWSPSSYVNDVLYTYYIGEFAGPPPFADAVEVPVDPLAYSYRAVASTVGLWGGIPASGEYFTGLTRDDVGGWRYLYGASGRWLNPNIENLLPDTTGSQNCPWCPVTGTNNVGTNTVVDLALRPGVDKITFQLGRYDSMFGSFITVTNQYEDRYITNYTLKTQSTQRVLTQPDILFAAEDLLWAILTRTSTAGWINNDPINGSTTLDGPGVIPPPVTISFNKIGITYFNYNPDFMDEVTAARNYVWGSFDGTTNAPVVFLPDGQTIQDLVQFVLGGN